MVAQFILMVSNCLANCSSWFFEIMYSSGMYGFFLFGFVTYTVFRLLVKPLVGAASSDLAHRAVRARDPFWKGSRYYQNDK